MKDHGHGVGDIGAVIAVHIAGMYLPSPLSGRLLDRFGSRVLASLSGSVLLLSSLLAAAMPGQSMVGRPSRWRCWDWVGTSGWWPGPPSPPRRCRWRSVPGTQGTVDAMAPDEPADLTPATSVQHWDDRYRTLPPGQGSWHQDHPKLSLELLAAVGGGADRSIIDVGGGTSVLIDHLLEAGHQDITVLDISSVALDTTRARLGDPPGVTWLAADLTTWAPPRRWDLWHDRAVLHFLTEPADRASYVETLRRSLLPGGAFVIATFAEDGPTHCSGLRVVRYSPDTLVDLLGDIDLVETRREIHHTPAGADQPFTWVAGRFSPPPRAQP